MLQCTYKWLLQASKYLPITVKPNWNETRVAALPEGLVLLWLNNPLCTCCWIEMWQPLVWLCITDVSCFVEHWCQCVMRRPHWWWLGFAGSKPSAQASKRGTVKQRTEEVFDDSTLLNRLAKRAPAQVSGGGNSEGRNFYKAADALAVSSPLDPHFLISVYPYLISIEWPKHPPVNVLVNKISPWSSNWLTTTEFFI